mmetsp:Transcript_33503/g.107696  ORF Transcript_33503/g.107696 Transcript_33503/m.107696 type:complete len:275 (+) Transcript_33503:26-850(+)
MTELSCLSGRPSLIYSGLHDGKVCDVLRGATLPGRGVLVRRDLHCRGRLEAARVVKVGADDVHVLQVVCAQPDVDRLGGEAAVREGKHRCAARPEHAPDLLADLERLSEVVDAHDVGHHVEGIVLERKPRVNVEVLDDVLRDLAVPRELLLVHAQRDASARGLRHVGREVGDVRRADVEDIWRLPLAKGGRVVLGQGRHRSLVHVVAEARQVIEARVGALVLPRKVRSLERKFRRPVRQREHLGDALCGGWKAGQGGLHELREEVEARRAHNQG